MSCNAGPSQAPAQGEVVVASGARDAIQAMIEQLVIVSSDSSIPRYGVPVAW
jgi:hypothetical protein